MLPAFGVPILPPPAVEAKERWESEERRDGAVESIDGRDEVGGELMEIVGVDAILWRN